MLADLGKFLARVGRRLFGAAIIAGALYDLFVIEAKRATPLPTAHYLFLALVVVFGLAFVGGQHALKALDGITAWTRAWRKGDPTP